MGNTWGGKRVIKVMKVDGAVIKLKSPARAESVLSDHPGYNIFEADQVKQLGLDARPLHPDTPLLSKKLYFLVELPRVPDQRVPRRAWSGALQLSAKERLENLRLARRTMSDISRAAGRRSAMVGAEESTDGAVRLKMRLSKTEVERIMQGSRDPTEVAEKIMELCSAKEDPAQKVAAPPPVPVPAPALRAGLKERRARFAAMPDEIIA